MMKLMQSAIHCPASLISEGLDVRTMPGLLCTDEVVPDRCLESQLLLNPPVLLAIVELRCRLDAELDCVSDPTWPLSSFSGLGTRTVFEGVGDVGDLPLLAPRARADVPC